MTPSVWFIQPSRSLDFVAISIRTFKPETGTLQKWGPNALGLAGLASWQSHLLAESPYSKDPLPREPSTP